MVRHDIATIEKVKNLRSQGKTYSEIMSSLKIKVPKSTISDWCTGVKLPTWYQQRIDELNKKSFSKAQKMAWVSNKIKRERLANEIINNNSHLLEKTKDGDFLKVILSFLYLGEGAKWKSHHGLMLGNSDPNIINLYIKLLNKCYGISLNSMKCRLCYRADQNLDSLQRFWSRKINIPLKNFYKTKPDARTIGKPTLKEGYKGVCVITCGGTHFQLELEAIPRIILSGL
jgi:hypothetical protein